MEMMNQVANTVPLDSGWKSLYRIGGVAALIAGVLFRRNIAAEIGLFSKHPSPATVSNWFALLQSNRLLGLSYLNIFDLVNYALVGLMFLALYAVLKRANKSYMAIATTLGFLGIAVYFASTGLLHAFPQRSIRGRDNRSPENHVAGSRAGDAGYQSF